MSTRQIDHLVYATPDLARGVSEIEALTGVRASVGGQHLGWGTRNCLAALGIDIYLEIIAPDPAQPQPPRPRPFGIDGLLRSRLVTWSARCDRLERVVHTAAQNGKHTWDTGKAPVPQRCQTLLPETNAREAGSPRRDKAHETICVPWFFAVE